MRCPKCSSESLFVMDVLPALDTKVYRRRCCSVCDFRFNTVELSEDTYVRSISDAVATVVTSFTETFKSEYGCAYKQKHKNKKNGGSMK